MRQQFNQATHTTNAHTARTRALPNTHSCTAHHFNERVAFRRAAPTHEDIALSELELSYLCRAVLLHYEPALLAQTATISTVIHVRETGVVYYYMSEGSYAL